MKQFGGYIRFADSVPKEEIRLFFRKLRKQYLRDKRLRDKALFKMLKEHKPISLEGY